MKQSTFLIKLFLFHFLLMIPCQGIEFENTPKLLVRGEASIFKPADTMEITLGVVAADAQPSKAIEENQRKIQQIMTNLNAIGLNTSDYLIGRVHTRPFKLLKGSEEKNLNSSAKYEALNTIQIKTQKISLENNIIHAAIQGGANQITRVNFSLNDPQSYQEEAIKLATQNALANATVLSTQAGVKLMRVLTLTLEITQKPLTPFSISPKKEIEGTVQANIAGEDIIEPEQLEIHAIVNISYEISSQK